MRKEFAKQLYERMKENKDIWLITADLGFGVWDKIRDDFPDRFINTGASEQAAMGLAVGLALSGKIPFVYSITTFLIYRPFEWIRNYLNEEKIPVRLIGSGRDKDYEVDGFSHDASDIDHFLKEFNNIDQHYPKDKEGAIVALVMMIDNNNPSFISLKR